MSIQPLLHDQIDTTRTLITNPTTEKFLFCFTIKTLSMDAYCGFTLRAGLKISSLILLFIATSNLYTILKEESYYTIFSTLFLSILYLTASYYLFTSSLHLKLESIKIGYYILCTILLIDLTDYISVIILTMFGFFYSYLNDDFEFFIFGFILFGLTVILIEVYILWSVYCFMIHLMMNRIHVIIGDSMKDYLDESM